MEPPLDHLAHHRFHKRCRQTDDHIPCWPPPKEFTAGSRLKHLRAQAVALRRKRLDVPEHRRRIFTLRFGAKAIAQHGNRSTDKHEEHGGAAHEPACHGWRSMAAAAAAVVAAVASGAVVVAEKASKSTESTIHNRS